MPEFSFAQREIEEYDKLPSEVKKMFREQNIDFNSAVWFQCSMLSSDPKEQFEMFKRAYLAL